MIPYPEDLVDHDHLERARSRYNEAVAARQRAQGAAVDAADALKSAVAARDTLVLRSSKEGNVPPRDALLAHRAVADAEAGLVFAREALDATEAQIVATQKALNAASGEAHIPVLDHAVALRVAAAGALDRALLQLDAAKAAYAEAGELAVQAGIRGARRTGAPILANGPFGRRPGEHEAAERAAWGRPPREPMAAE